MVKRRPLADGLKSSPQADPEKEKAFISGVRKSKSAPASKAAKPKPQPVEEEVPPPSVAPETPLPQPHAPSRGGRFPLTTRLRADIGEALKRASLERQLAGKTPYMVQDILDLVLEPWLRTGGYLK